MKTTRGRTLDHAAAIYDWVQPIVTLGAEKRLNQKLADQLAIAPHHHVLDVGCGTGTLTALIATQLRPEQAGLIVGIDAAPRMIDVARRKRQAPTVQFHTGVAENLPFTNDSFDRACSAFFFHHVDYELKVLALRELRRVLRPTGRLLILDIDVPTTWGGQIIIRLGEWLFQQPEIAENRRGLLRQAFIDAGCHGWREIAHWQGYITLFAWDKPS